MGGYGKTVSHVIIGLKTAKGNKQLKVCYSCPNIFQNQISLLQHYLYRKSHVRTQ